MLEGRVTVGGDYREVCWREGSELAGDGWNMTPWPDCVHRN